MPKPVSLPAVTSLTYLLSSLYKRLSAASPIPSVTSSTTFVITFPALSNMESSVPALLPLFPAIPPPVAEPLFPTPLVPGPVVEFPAMSVSVLSLAVVEQAVAVQIKAIAIPSARNFFIPAELFPFFIVSSILLRELNHQSWLSAVKRHITGQPVPDIKHGTADCR